MTMTADILPHLDTSASTILHALLTILDTTSFQVQLGDQSQVRRPQHDDTLSTQHGIVCILSMCRWNLCIPTGTDIQYISLSMQGVDPGK